MSFKAPCSFPVDKLPPFPLGEIAHRVIELRAKGREVFDLSQLNPSIPPSGGAIERLVQATLQPHNHKYSASQGITRLREAMVSWYQRRYSVSLCPESELIVTLGTKQGLSHLLYATLTAGDTVLIPTPCYPIHSAATILAGASCALFALPRIGDKSGNTAHSAKSNSRIDIPNLAGHAPVLDADSDEFFENLRRSHSTTWPRPVFLVVSFPHNPTGTVVTRSFFERLVEEARELGLYIIHDFAYSDLSFSDSAPPSILQVQGAKELAVELYSVSKGLNMPGWRVGLCAGNEHLISALRKIKSYLDCGVFQPLQIASAFAFDNYESIILETRDLYRSRRKSAITGLKDIHWFEGESLGGNSSSLPISEGGLFLWLQIPVQFRHLGSLAFCRLALDKTGVALAPGIGFDPGADDCIRLALSESEERIRRAVASLSELFV